MESNFKIIVPKPCHENWNAMKAEEKGRFCSSCTKVVVDFTQMKSTEIQNYLIENSSVSVCGHFKKQQLHQFDFEIPRKVLFQKRTFQKGFLLALFIAMGSSLFSCKNHNDATLGEVTITNTIKKNPVKNKIIMGLLLPPKNKSLVDGQVEMIINKDTVTSKK